MLYLISWAVSNLIYLISWAVSNLIYLISWTVSNLNRIRELAIYIDNFCNDLTKNVILFTLMVHFNPYNQIPGLHRASKFK